MAWRSCPPCLSPARWACSRTWPATRCSQNTWAFHRFPAPASWRSSPARWPARGWFPVVQHLSGAGVHGRRRRAGDGRGARLRGGDRAPGDRAAGDGRRVRDGNRVGDDPGGELQAHRQARVPDGADPPPLRVEGLAGAAGDRALLDHFGGAGAGWPGPVEGALMTIFDSSTQARRRNGPRGRYDLWLLVALIGLASIGVVMVASSSIAVADSQHLGPFYFLRKHLVFLGLGVIAAGLAMRTELKLLEKFAFPLLALAFTLLLAVFVPHFGMRINGAHRWLNLLVTTFQPVE